MSRFASRVFKTSRCSPVCRRLFPDLPKNLKVGLFAGSGYPAWVRFSSDTLPTISDYKTTCGIGIKLFNSPTPKIFGLPEETTFDFILENFDVFFVNTAKDMCEFTYAGVVDGDYDTYLKAHPETAKILDAMAKPVASVLEIDIGVACRLRFGSRSIPFSLTIGSNRTYPTNFPTACESHLFGRRS